MIKNFLKQRRLVLLGLAIGAAAGYLYWMYVGCNSGTCPITSSPVNSSLWGAVLGGLLFDIFKKKSKNTEDKKKSDS